MICPLVSMHANLCPVVDFCAGIWKLAVAPPVASVTEIIGLVWIVVVRAGPVAPVEPKFSLVKAEAPDPYIVITPLEPEYISDLAFQ